MIEQSRECFETCVKRELESVAQSTRAIIYSDARFAAILRVTVVEANGFGTRCMSLYLYLSRVCMTSRLIDCWAYVVHAPSVVYATIKVHNDTFITNPQQVADTTQWNEGHELYAFSLLLLSVLWCDYATNYTFALSAT